MHEIYELLLILPIIIAVAEDFLAEAISRRLDIVQTCLHGLVLSCQLRVLSLPALDVCFDRHHKTVNSKLKLTQNLGQFSLTLVDEGPVNCVELSDHIDV